MQSNSEKYLEFEGFEFPSLKLSQVLYEHERIASEISASLNIQSSFKDYLRHGFYPFYTEGNETDYWIRVNNMLSSVIDYDIPAVENVEYATLIKAKHLLSIMASQSPSNLNAKNTAEMLGVTPNQLIKIFSLLEKSQILRLLFYKTERSPKSLAKPQKVLFDNPSLLYAMDYANIGKVRESFFATMLSVGHEVAFPQKGDLLVDNRYLFEIGGARKGFDQIKDIPDSFVVADEIEFGIGNKIPLWLFGFLY